LGRPVRKNPVPPSWVSDEPDEPRPKQRPPGADGPSEPETEEDKALPRNQQSAKSRRKREPRTSFQPGYQEGPVGDKTCGARKEEGSRCSRAAGWGTDHVGYGPCKYHLGSTPTGRKASAYEMAGELMVFYGSPIDTNPIEALLDEVSRTAGHVAWLGQVIGRFNVPLEEEVDKKGGITVRRPAGIPPEVDGWIKMYQSERNQLVRVSKAALDAGVNERLVQIAEHQATKFANAIETILDELGLTASQQMLVPQVVPRVLRSLAASPALLEGVVVDDDVSD